MESVNRKKEQIHALCKQDVRYQNMRLACSILEAKADAIIQQLPNEDSDIVWDFIMLCEAMSDRMLEIACEKL